MAQASVNHSQSDLDSSNAFHSLMYASTFFQLWLHLLQILQQAVLPFPQCQGRLARPLSPKAPGLVQVWVPRLLGLHINNILSVKYEISFILRAQKACA